jgi:hypothetical protein
MIEERQQPARMSTGRRRLLAGAAGAAGRGLAGGLGLAGGIALDDSRTPARPGAAAVDTSLTLLRPSGDTSGATDYRAIQKILTPTPERSGLNTVVLLGSGIFYVSQTITFMAPQQAIRGQGQNITSIVAADGFTAATRTGPARATAFEAADETAVIYTGRHHQFLIVDGLTIQGPAAASGNSLALGGSGQLNGVQQSGGAIRCQFTNLHFLGINGWPVIFDGRGGNNAETLIENVLAEGCPALCYLQGDQDGYRGSATMTNVSGVSMTKPGGAMAAVPAAFVIRDYEDLLTWSATPSLIEGRCSSCFFYAVDVGSTVLLADTADDTAAATAAATADDTTDDTTAEKTAGKVYSPTDIGFYGGIVEADSGNRSGIRITGGAQQIAIGDLKIAYNTNHGISVEGTGDQIQIRNCQFQDNGKAGSADGTAYYDLNWTGNASGVVHDCTFDTAVRPAGTPGVAASVNFAAAAGGTSDARVGFADCQFPQSGSTGPMFNQLPNTSTVRDCTPYSPVGAVAVSVPASGGSTAPLSHDAAFYITASPAARCTATVNGTAITIPAGALVPVFVPAGSTLALSYGQKPAWTVNGH